MDINSERPWAIDYPQRNRCTPEFRRGLELGNKYAEAVEDVVAIQQVEPMLKFQLLTSDVIVFQNERKTHLCGTG